MNPARPPFSQLAHMAGLLLRWRGIGELEIERIRPDGLEEHPPCRRDACLSPVRNGRVFDLAKTGHGRRAAQGVDDVGIGVFGIHAPIIRHALFYVKRYLTIYKGIPNRVAIRIAE